MQGACALRGRFKGWKTLGAVLLFSLTVAGPAASENDPQVTHTVHIVVPSAELSIAEDVGNFTLTFSDSKEGSLTDSRVINYHVQGNTFPPAPLAGMISASSSAGVEGIQLQADTGAFTNGGSEGNIILSESAAGFQPVGASPVPLANKEATSGGQARVLNGTLPVTWRAEATHDLQAGDQSVTLTVTLKDQ